MNLGGYAPAGPVRPADALAGLLRSLGVPAEQVPAEVTEAAARFRSLVAGRRMLIILDNARSAEKVRPLLPGRPGCLVLITSRDRLSGLLARDGARRIVLDRLSPEESAELLARLLGPARAAEGVAELAKLCAHLPLALRIAAAYLADRTHLTITRYVAELRAGDPLTTLAIAGDEPSAVRPRSTCRTGP